MRCHKLSDEDVVPICSPRLLDGETALRVPQDLRRATLIHVSNRIDRWPDWLAAAGVDHPAPTQGPKLPTTALALEAAESGLGVALANRLFAEPHLASGRLALPFEVDYVTGRGYYLVYPAERADLPMVEAFRIWLLAQSADGDPPAISASR